MYVYMYTHLSIHINTPSSVFYYNIYVHIHHFMYIMYIIYIYIHNVYTGNID